MISLLFFRKSYQFRNKGFSKKGKNFIPLSKVFLQVLIRLHAEWPKLYRVLAILSAVGLNKRSLMKMEKSYF